MFVRDMYDRESEMMLDFIGESRMAMLGAADELTEEQEDLRRCATRLGKDRKMCNNIHEFLEIRKRMLKKYFFGITYFLEISKIV